MNNLRVVTPCSSARTDVGLVEGRIVLKHISMFQIKLLKS
jgi:hypothetical protein